MPFDIEDPQGLLRPWRDLKQFSEELYAMVTRRGTPVASGPDADAAEGESPGEPPRRPREDPRPTGITAERTIRARPTPPPPAPLEPPPPRRDVAAQSRAGFPTEPDRAPNAVTQYATPASRDRANYRDLAASPDLELAPPPARNRRDYTDPSTAAAQAREQRKLAEMYDPSVGMKISPGGGGNGGLIGKVVSGGPGEYLVMLYPEGPAVEPGEGEEPVVVTILMFDELDQPIPPDSWMTSIFEYEGEEAATYFCQPPVWMA